MVLLQPGRVLSSREGEEMGGVILDEIELVGDGSSDLASGLAQRPQPGGVNVGMADGRHRLGRVVGRTSEDWGQLGPSR